MFRYNDKQALMQQPRQSVTAPESSLLHFIPATSRGARIPFASRSYSLINARSSVNANLC